MMSFRNVFFFFTVRLYIKSRQTNLFYTTCLGLFRLVPACSGWLRVVLGPDFFYKWGITGQFLRQMYSEHCQKFKIEHFAKKIMPDCRHATRKFSEQERFWGNISSKTQEKKTLQGNIFEFFLLDNQDTRKGQGKPPLSPSCTPVNVAEYVPISVNILENAWINCSDYARALNMHDHLTCFTGFWRYLRF